MGRTIWKFQLKMTELPTIRMPKGAEVLSVQDQMGHLCLWAIVDPDEEMEDRHFRIFGTGHPIVYPTGDFIGTVQQGQFVWHIFDTVEHA